MRSGILELLQKPTETGQKLYIYVLLFLLARQPPVVGHGLLIQEVSRSHTTTHHSR